MDTLSLQWERVYSIKLEEKINQEFLQTDGNCYLDHAGATLYSKTQLENIFSDLTTNTYVNPHGNNYLSKNTIDAIDIIRYQILQFFNTNPKEYSVIFTSSATASLKIVAECFQYGDASQGTLLYLENNHTSVLGMRAFSENVRVVTTSEAFETLSPNLTQSHQDLVDNNSLFVYPAQCNFSGTKFPLEWINKVQNGYLNKLVESKSKSWYVLLDAASFVSTNKLDLAKFKPDFIPISFYKIFGYPTGIGALLIRNGSEKVLQKKYYGGGTVLMAMAAKTLMVPRTVLYERFEDGTLPFLSILSLRHGFENFKKLDLDMDIISKHTFSLAKYVYKNMITLRHSNGNHVAILYHDSDFEERTFQGGIVNFNLLRPDGEYVGYAEVLHMANLYNIIIRTGCSCNPGACQRFLRLNEKDVIKHFKAGHICGDENDLINGHPTGSVRISFGYMSTESHANTFLKMVETCFVSSPIIRKMSANLKLRPNIFQQFPNKNLEKSPQHRVENFANNLLKNQIIVRNDEKEAASGTLTDILLYPIKSCGSFSVKQWLITETGFKYDRQWMIVNSVGTAFTQKNCTKLCFIKPYIDLESRILRLEFKDHTDLKVSLDTISRPHQPYIYQSKICNDIVKGWDCGNDVAKWLSDCLETPGLRLIRQPTLEETTDFDSRQISFANKAQFLLVNSKSVKWLADRFQDNFQEDLQTTIERFRPNFIVDLPEAFQENEVNNFIINNVTFKNVEKCTRCQMICINQQTGEKTKEPLLTLSKEFKGKISFGVYLKHENDGKLCTINSGSKIYTN